MTKKQTDRIDVAYVAHLARLHLSDDEVERFQGQLNEVVGYVQKLQELELEGIEPMSHASRIENVFRDDEVRPSLNREDVLANAPELIKDQFRVPKIVE